MREKGSLTLWCNQNENDMHKSRESIDKQQRAMKKNLSWLWAALVLIAAVIAGYLMWINPVS